MTDRYNPQHGANMVDRYIGSAFDIVYAVYKQLGSMPVFLEFVNETSPRMEDQYADIIGRFDHIVDLEASALNSKEVAVQAATDAMEYRDTTQQLIDEAEEFKQFVINVVENTIQDIEDRFAEFIVASGYEFIGNYGIGIEVTEYNQLLRDVDGEFWRLSGQRSIPYITTGAGLPEDDAFIPVGDASLRQDLDDPVHGSKIVQYDENNTVYDAINRNREDFWANKETLGGIYTHYVREDDGTPVAGAECAVYVGKTGVLATGLKDKFGEPLANPFVTTTDGLVQFVADPGMYTLQVSFDLVVHTYSVYFADDGLRNDLADSYEGASLIAYGGTTVETALGELEQFNADLANTTDPAKGAALVGYRGRDARQGLDDSISVLCFTPDGFDVTGSWNTVLDDAVAFSRVIRIPAGTTVFLQNWVPPVECVIDARGAYIRRLNDALYASTGASAAIIAADGTSTCIIGGTFDQAVSATSATFSGAVLLNGGSFSAQGSKFENTWSSVFGSSAQDGAKSSPYVALINCELKSCSHNAYLADIENLLVQGVRSHLSNRDGLKTYRNVNNVCITGSHFYDNGSGSPDQSQDGIDLYIAGKNCIITGNTIYGNAFKGIDIKHGNDGDPVQSANIIITGNRIYDNLDSGVEVDGNIDAGAAVFEGVNISDNIISGNGLYGVLLTDVKDPKVTGNEIFGNLRVGIRADGSQNSIVIEGNAIYSNGTPSGVAGSGVLLSATNTYAIVSGNSIHAGAGGNQTQGVFIACAGDMSGNRINGHTSDISSAVVNGTLTGREYVSPVTDGQTLCFIAPKDGLITAAEISLGATGSVNVTISKRNATTGASASTLMSAVPTSVTGYATQVLPIAASASARRVTKGQAVYIELSGLVFTTGCVIIKMID